MSRARAHSMKFMLWFFGLLTGVNAVVFLEGLTHQGIIPGYVPFTPIVELLLTGGGVVVGLLGSLQFAKWTHRKRLQAASAPAINPVSKADALLAKYENL